MLKTKNRLELKELAASASPHRNQMSAEQLLLVSGGRVLRRATYDEQNGVCALDTVTIP